MSGLPTTTHSHATPPFNDDGTLDADAVLHAIETALDAALAALAPSVCAVAFVAFTSFVMNLVGVDSRGNVATPLLTVRGPPCIAHSHLS